MTLTALRAAFGQSAGHVSPFLVLGDPRGVRQAQIVQVRPAMSLTGLLLGFHERWHQQPCQDRDNGDDDEEFYESEGALHRGAPEMAVPSYGFLRPSRGLHPTGPIK